MEINGTAERKGLQRLRCSVKNYDWGRIGRESRVARMSALNTGVETEQEKPYAELWMGTHDSGPSWIEKNPKKDDEDGRVLSLKSWIERNPNVLGDKVIQKWGVNLPFLFKVLAVDKALSIQAHPDKEMAEIMHKAQPDVFKDANHKPEMALAVTEFQALCGFIRLEELKEVLRNVPEITEVIGNEYANQMLDINNEDEGEKAKAVLRLLFTRLMSANKGVISEALSKLIRRLNMASKMRQLTDKEQLVLWLEKQYPADIGVLATFLFNYVKLQPGEALYLGANELHAYISGECIECMATSDNVVRAGLTPKDRDVQILCSMLTYKQGWPDILQGVHVNPYTKRYLPPFDEFEVDHCILPKGASSVFPAVPGPSVFVITDGKGTMSTKLLSEEEDTVAEGDVLFAPANTEINVTAAASSELQMYRAGINSRFLQASS